MSASRPVSKTAIACLFFQHSSSACGEQSLEFAAYLFLITLYPFTLVPASLLGLSITVSTVLASTSIGQKVDTEHRFLFVRKLILTQKICQACCYAIFLILFSHVSAIEEPTRRSISWFSIGLLMIFASGGRIATTGIDLAVCRDWILVIASESNSATHGASGSGDGRLNALLTFLTTSLRRITLICKLLSPLLISLLTTTLGYRSTTALLVAFTVITLISEMVWIRVVWRKFEVLEQAEVLRQARRDMEESATRGQAGIEVEDGPRGALLQNASRACHFLEDDSDSGHQRRRVTEQRQPQRRLLDSAVRALVPWNEFRKMPIFLSSISISCLYLTTVSFDSIMISYLKSVANLSDLFIAVMRGVSVIMGLLGTLFMPVLERKIGITRAGAWSIWGEVASLLPTVLCLFKGPGPLTASSLASVINTLIFFATLSISRLWLYCFDLVQLQGLLLALEHHPQRSEFAAMQVTMENLFDLAKYSVVLVLNKPEQYKWTAMISLICVFIAGITYSTYLFQDRGHVFHFGKKNDDVYPTDTQDSELLLLASGVDR